MGRQTLLSALCWLTLNLTLGDKKTYSSGFLDNESAESARRLYRHVPLGVYASAVPYGAHSYHLPTFIVAPQTSASQVVPVKENYVNHLTDSYGNKFVGTPQSSSYKIGFPQQFVSLQTKLPDHLAQPLVAASANFQFKPSNGQFFGVPYRVSSLHGPTPTPLNHFPTFGQLYGEKVQNLSPSSVIHSQAYGIPNIQQQSTNNKAVVTNTYSQSQYNNHKGEQKGFQHKEPQIIIGKPKVQGVNQDGHGEDKFQRIQEVTHSSYGEPKFQRSQQEPVHYKDVKSQRIQDAPVIHHDQSKLKEQHQSGDSEQRYQHVQEFPHYESKFQIIEEQPQSPQLNRIQEHHVPQGEMKFQSLHDPPSIAQTQHIYEGSQEKSLGDNDKIVYGKNAKLQGAPGKKTVTYINDINGEKTIVELDTKPTLPLLDLTLLEPLTFDNPLVPQVQHFLPRISQATYQKLPQALPVGKNYQNEYALQKTTSYNSANGHKKLQEESKKKQKKPTQSNKYPKKNDSPKKTTVTYHDTLDDAPEISYEINSPNYQETVKQKAISYNKETQSEPVHYTYGSKSAKEPVTYSYSRTSKEPVLIKNVQYHSKGPSHLIYTFKPEEQTYEEKTRNSAPHNSESPNEKESSHQSDHDSPYYHQHHTEQYKENPNSAKEQHGGRQPAPQEKENYQSQEKTQEIEHDDPPKYYSEPAHIISENINFQPILKEYENNIRLLTTPSASIKVDPNQHIHHPKPTPQALVSDERELSQPHHDHPHSSPAPQKVPHSSNEHHRSQYHPSPPLESYNTPAPHIHEKSKRIIIQEESPGEMHMLREQMREEVVKQEENSEEDFEKGYQDAAIGFPAYNRKSSDPEKDIFDPESYGVPRDHAQYDFEHTPLQQYQEEGDEFPTETRSRYKDARDKTMQNYYSDFSISKPESLLDRYQNKLGYYKLFKEQKPDYLHDDEEDEKKQEKSAKYSAAPSFRFNSRDDRSKSYYGSPKPKQQQLYEYDYSKGTPRDSSAFASRPYQNYKSQTSFVEPQFQYGFEPIAIPKLLDSELAAMASNDSPESEKPGMRKKIYKENWYIKKTSTSAGAPAS